MTKTTTLPPPGYGINTSGQTARMADAEASYAAAQRRGRDKMGSQRRWENAFKLASAAIVGGAGMAGGAAAGGAVNPAWGAGMLAPNAAVGSAAGLSLMRLAEIGIPVATSLYGNRQQNRSQDRALEFERRSAEENMAFLREQEAEKRRQWEAIYGPDGSEKRAFDADQEQRRLDRAAADEERAFTRSTFEAKEGRRGPFRAVGRGALMSLADMAGIRTRPLSSVGR